jgi:hypothetical protein
MLFGPPLQGIFQGIVEFAIKTTGGIQLADQDFVATRQLTERQHVPISFTRMGKKSLILDASWAKNIFQK